LENIIKLIEEATLYKNQIEFVLISSTLIEVLNLLRFSECILNKFDACDELMILDFQNFIL